MRVGTRPVAGVLTAVSLASCAGSDSTGPPEELEAPDYVSVSAGARHSCALDPEGQTWCWGFNGDGQLGLFPDADAGLRPTPLPSELRFADLAAGSSYTCGVTAAGGLHCWGSPPWATALVPRRVGNGEYTSAESRFSHACALRTDRRAECVGLAGDGQLGHGEHGEGLQLESPVEVQGLEDVRQLAAGATVSCARNGSGEVWCWGAHDAGALGIGEVEAGPCEVQGTAYACAPEPVLVPLDHTVVDVRAGYYHVCALTDAAEVFCWGDQQEGQLGETDDPETCTWAPPSGAERPCHRLPVRVETGGPAFESLRAGGFHTCGLTAEGEGWCWGSNSFGQLGLAAGFGFNGPGPVFGDHRWRDLALGQVHTCGVTVDAEAWCWGDGQWHQLGSGDEISGQPVQVLPPTVAAGSAPP